MTNPFKEEINKLVENAEKANHYPADFIQTIEYFHSIFAYILGLIEMKKNNKN